MKEKILVVDDEADIRKSLRMVLEYEGYECVEASSGPEGLETLRREAPDAVLLDIKMPSMDGLEVLATARARDPSTPILMISGHGDIPTAVEAIHKGAYDFLEKPLASERVLPRCATRWNASGCATRTSDSGTRSRRATS
jgi:two-component system nitrogen regulation response regulator NtrX